ncbi:hypothetical protein Cni_G29158 [Canna indica]|uniref:RDR1/2-like PH-like domain-containing protein n=1 Tax=Canna indica TaxID=4628 RepID=A0AAQ3QT90_9LILI|nr:hypothetical protein Cni_G29158 [Canna indica]
MAVFGEWEQVRVEIMPEMKKLELFFDHEGEKCKMEVMFVDILASFSCCLGGVESNTILLQGYCKTLQLPWRSTARTFIQLAMWNKFTTKCKKY